MLLTTLTLLLATTDPSITAEPPADEPTWALDYALTSPSLVGLSFNLASAPNGLGGLGLLSAARPAFTSTLSLERALGTHLTGIAAVSAAYTQVGASGSQLSGGGLLGLHWYRDRPFEGFWAGPEVLAQLSTLEVPADAGLLGNQTRAVGARVRAGWSQRFGAHFLISASAGLGVNLAFSTVASVPGTSAAATVNVVVDGALAAGLVF